MIFDFFSPSNWADADCIAVSVTSGNLSHKKHEELVTPDAKTSFGKSSTPFSESCKPLVLPQDYGRLKFTKLAAPLG